MINDICANQKCNNMNEMFFDRIKLNGEDVNVCLVCKTKTYRDTMTIVPNPNVDLPDNHLWSSDKNEG